LLDAAQKVSIIRREQLFPEFMIIPKSTFFKGFEWTGNRIGYPETDIKGDTYPCTWAADGEIYASSGDPLWGESIDGLDTEKFSGMAPDFKITKFRHMNDYTGWGGNGPKPSGMISVDGILYLAFQNLRRLTIPPQSRNSQPGADAHIVYYNMNVNPWQPDWVPTLPNIKNPMFPGYKFGGPAFVQYGKDNADARDEYVYAISSDQWDNGSNLRLGRVPKDAVVEAGKWEWVKAFDIDGMPVWTNKLEDAIPILSMHRRLGCPEMVYLASCDRYLLLSWHLKGDFDAEGGTDLLIFDAPNPWGPFTLVQYEEFWEGKAFTPYCPRVPLKWFDPATLSGWMLFSGSWGTVGQKEGYYRANIRPFRLTRA